MNFTTRKACMPHTVYSIIIRIAQAACLMGCILSPSFMLTDAYAEEKRSITDTGDVMLGIGDIISFQSYDGTLYKTAEDKKCTFNTTARLEPQVFLYKGFALGLTINLNYLAQKTSVQTIFNVIPGNSAKTDSLDFQFGPGIAYYLNIGNKYFPFLGFTYLYSRLQYEVTDTSSQNSFLEFIIDTHSSEIAAGFCYMLVSYFGLYASYSFIIDTQKKHDCEFSGMASDELILMVLRNANKNVIGFRHKVSIGFKIAFDTR